MNILVTGIPGSGYEKVTRMLRRHSEGWYPDLSVTQFHYRGEDRIGKVSPIFDNIMGGEWTHVVVVMRREGDEDEDVDGYARLCRAHYDTLYSCAGVPMIVVTYEEMEQAPDFTGWQIARFLGIEWKGWAPSASETTS